MSEDPGTLASAQTLTPNVKAIKCLKAPRETVRLQFNGDVQRVTDVQLTANEGKAGAFESDVFARTLFTLLLKINKQTAPECMEWIAHTLEQIEAPPSQVRVFSSGSSDEVPGVQSEEKDWGDVRITVRLYYVPNSQHPGVGVGAHWK